MVKNIIVRILKDAVEEIELLKNTSGLSVEDLTLTDFTLRYKSILELIRKSLSSAIDELSENKKLCSIISQVEKFQKSHAELPLMEQKLGKIIIEEETFNKNLENEAVHSFNMIKEKEECIGKLKDHYEDLIHEFEIKERFIKNWEKARLDQMILKLKKNLDSVEFGIQKFEQKTEWEFRVHFEIISFTYEVMKDTQNNIDIWEEKYATDLKMYNEKIIDLKNKKFQQKERFTNTYKLFKDRENEMIQYAKFKEAQRIEAERMMYLNAQATKIQAWWRGVMVRRKLGPYKVKKTKGKSTKDSKKNKK